MTEKLSGDFPGYTDYEQDGLGGGAGRLGAVFLLFLSLVLAAAAGIGFSLLRQHEAGHLVLPLACCTGIVLGLLAAVSYRAFRLDVPVLRAALLLGIAAVPSILYWFSLPPELHASARTLTILGQTLPFADVVHAGTILLLVLGVLATGCVVYRRGYLCETCERWGKGHRVLSPLYLCVPEPTAFSLLARGNVSPLVSASPVPTSTSQTALTAVVRYCTTCRRGALWVLRSVSGGSRRAVPGLGRIPLDAESVRSLLEISS